MNNKTTATAPTDTQQPRFIITGHRCTTPEAYTYVDTRTGQRAEALVRDLVHDKEFVNGLIPMEAMRLGWNAAQDSDNTFHHVAAWMGREKLNGASVMDWEEAGSPTAQLELDANSRPTDRGKWSDTGEYVDDRCRHCRKQDAEATA